MKKTTHPDISEITVEGILHALSDPVRIAIYASLQQAESAKNCSAFLAFDKKKIPKSTLSQHLSVLRDAGLIRSERKGVEVYNTTRCDEIKDSWGNMVYGILKAYAEQQTKTKKLRTQKK